MLTSIVQTLNPVLTLYHKLQSSQMESFSRKKANTGKLLQLREFFLRK